MSDISNLPNELIIEILQRVDQDSLGSAILTCKLWKQLIESSCSWSLVLNHENGVGYDERKLAFMLTSNRKFHTIKINGLLELGKNHTIDILRRHGSSVLKLFLFNCCLDKIDLFVEVLKCLPNLKHVIMFSITTLWSISDVPAEHNLPELLKLKTLEIVQSKCSSIVKCFTKAQLQTIKILGSASESLSWTDGPDPVSDLLRLQQNLTTLVLRSIDWETSQLFRTDILNTVMPFQLTQLSLLDIKLRESPNDYNNLLKFMKQQAKTIKELELGRRFPDFVYEFVFSKFKNLKSLRLMINELPKDMEFYKRLEESRSINNLILIDSTPPNHLNKGCSPSLQEFFRHVPNVTNLTLLDYCDRGTIMFIATYFNRLKKLNVKHFDGSVFADVQFHKLTSLNIYKLFDGLDWDRFTKNNSHITELTIATLDFEEMLNVRDIEKISTNLKLQKLRIDNNFVTDERFFDIIRKNCSNLKMLGLRQSSVRSAPDLTGLGDVPGLRFYANSFIMCCNGLEFWNDDDYDGRLPDDRGSGNWDTDGLDPFDMHHLMEIDDFDDYDQIEDFDDDVDIDEFHYEYDEDSDYDLRFED